MINSVFKKVEWPGIATLAAIVLIVCITMDLSKWQPLLASLIALGGGALAYKGAMAKIALEEDQHKRELLRRQLALYLKLSLAASRLHAEAQSLSAELGFRQPHDVFRLDRLRLKEPVEISEAWDSLDVFPRPLIREIATIRERIFATDDALEKFSEHLGLGPGDGMKGNYLDTVLAHVDILVDACSLLRRGLEPAIDLLAPELSGNERMIALYGLPDDQG